MTADRPQVLSYVVAAIAMAAMAVIGFYYLVSGLMAPIWAVIGLLAFWVFLVVLGIRWFRLHPLRVLLLPVIAAVVWYGVMSLGDVLLGWTA